MNNSFLKLISATFLTFLSVGAMCESKPPLPIAPPASPSTAAVESSRVASEAVSSMLVLARPSDTVVSTDGLKSKTRVFINGYAECSVSLERSLVLGNHPPWRVLDIDCSP